MDFGSNVVGDGCGRNENSAALTLSSPLANLIDELDENVRNRVDESGKGVNYEYENLLLKRKITAQKLVIQDTLIENYELKESVRDLKERVRQLEMGHVMPNEGNGGQSTKSNFQVIDLKGNVVGILPQSQNGTTTGIPDKQINVNGTLPTDSTTDDFKFNTYMANNLMEAIFPKTETVDLTNENVSPTQLVNNLVSTGLVNDDESSTIESTGVNEHLDENIMSAEYESLEDTSSSVSTPIQGSLASQDERPHVKVYRSDLNLYGSGKGRGRPPKRGADRNFICSFCSKTFIHQQSLESHVNSVHLERIYKCTECSKSFSWLSSLSNHKRKAHGEKWQDGRRPGDVKSKT